MTEPSKSAARVPVNLFIFWTGTSEALPLSSWLLVDHQIIPPRYGILNGACLKVLEGHEELVQCLCFGQKRIVSKAYGWNITVWEWKVALNPQASALCLCTLVEHSRHVFWLQLDELQTISSSHDNTILIWDFLNMPPSAQNETCSPPEHTLTSPGNSLHFTPFRAS